VLLWSRKRVGLIGGADTGMGALLLCDVKSTRIRVQHNSLTPAAWAGRQSGYELPLEEVELFESEARCVR
jgi:hypothetical protein